MRVLVTGGAGYIGAHVVRLLVERGDDVLIVDDLIGGDPRRVPDVPLVKLDLAIPGAARDLARQLRDHGTEAVVHLAARKSAVDSLGEPIWYYEQNIGGLLAVTAAMTEAGIDRLVFSSSASVYGGASGQVSETAETVTLSPYGSTKLIGEMLLTDVARAGLLRAISLRYFNVAGSGWPELGDHIAANLVPMVFEKIDAGERPEIFGDDYNTPDGTCVRDYIHVLDLAEAHLAALDHLGTSPHPHRIYNVGTGIGTSVREMIDEIIRESGSSLIPVVRPRRPGDPEAVVATVDRIAEELGWRSRFGLTEVVSSAWASHLYLAQRDQLAG